MLKKKWLVYFAGLVCLLALVSAPVSATTISPGGGGEPNLEGSGATDILNYLYGWTNLTRIADPGDGIWVELDGGVKAEAKFAGNSPQTLGYYLGASGNYSNTILDGFIPIVPVTGTGYSVAPSTSTTFLASLGHDTFRFGMLSAGKYWSSLQSENPANEDKMVTWLITGSAGHSNTVGNYVIAWEDGTDQDYQDLVVEVSKAAPPVPEPGTLLLLGAGLVGLVGYAKVRINRKKK